MDVTDTEDVNMSIAAKTCVSQEFHLLQWPESQLDVPVYRSGEYGVVISHSESSTQDGDFTTGSQSPIFYYLYTIMNCIDSSQMYRRNQLTFWSVEDFG